MLDVYIIQNDREFKHLLKDLVILKGIDFYLQWKRLAT